MRHDELRTAPLGVPSARGDSAVVSHSGMLARMRSTLALLLMLPISACGAAGGSARTARGAAIEPADFLTEVGAETAVLRRPERSIDELEAARGEASGTERRTIVRDLVVAHVFAAEDADEREARRLRRRAERMADAAVRGSRDAQLNADIAFLKLWMSWRAGAGNAATRAERFTDRHRESGDLLLIAWMIRGELAIEAERWDDSLAAFRFALGSLEHPLYAYALYRSAHSYRALERADDATQALSEVEQLGCAPGASPLVVRLATAAASERGSGLRQDTDGVIRPASCPSPEERAREPERGWRPEE